MVPQNTIFEAPTQCFQVAIIDIEHVTLHFGRFREILSNLSDFQYVEVDVFVSHDRAK